MAKPIVINLSDISTLKDAISKIQSYKSDLKVKCETLIKRLSDLGENVALQGISQSPLGNNVHIRIDRQPETMGCKAVLIAVGNIVNVDGREPFNILLAIEFGAGIFYNNGNHNPKENDFGLGVGTYPGQIHAFEDGWYYLGDDNMWHYTHGIKATMPMYNASMEIIQQYKSIAREVFSDGK